jgi:hypothetical protein
MSSQDTPMGDAVEFRCRLKLPWAPFAVTSGSATLHYNTLRYTTPHHTTPHHTTPHHTTPHHAVTTPSPPRFASFSLTSCDALGICESGTSSGQPPAEEVAQKRLHSRKLDPQRIVGGAHRHFRGFFFRKKLVNFFLQSRNSQGL